jgi:hypothetical protein
MAVPHFNFYPPAGQVIDASDGRVTWDGRAWKLSGRVYGVPSTHSLVGKPGTSMSGWYYDWGKRAWMEPSAPKPAPPPTRPNAVMPVMRRPQPVRAGGTTVVAIEPTKLNPIESLMKHPIAPVLGGVLVAASYLTDEPQPPSVPEGLPESTAKQWMMVYNQNQQRFTRRMDLFKDLGMVLLGYASAQTIMDALPSKPDMTTTTMVDADVRARSLAGHRAL